MLPALLLLCSFNSLISVIVITIAPSISKFFILKYSSELPVWDKNICCQQFWQSNFTIICRTCYWQHLTNAWRYKKEPAGTGKIPFSPSPLAINPTDLPHKYNVPALFLSDKTSPYTTGNIQFPLFAQHSLCKIQFFFQTSSFLLQILYSKQNAFDNHFCKRFIEKTV